MSNSRQPNIAIIGTAAFLRASKLLGSHNFELCLRSSDIQANSAKLAETPDLSNVPSKYHEFADVFSKTKAEVLAPHYSYDLKINLEEGAQPLVGSIYSLSASEQEALKEFIEKNLNMGFIQLTSSLHGVPVLFVKKKDGSLCLCIDFYGLNHITVKIEESELDLFYFFFLFLFLFFDLLFYFLFLKQIGLGLIGHAVTSVTT